MKYLIGNTLVELKEISACFEVEALSSEEAIKLVDALITEMAKVPCQSFFLSDFEEEFK